jgi:hypothetical protein
LRSMRLNGVENSKGVVHCSASLAPSRLSKMCLIVARLMPRDRRTLDLCMES